jgi:cytochrome b pre-mRNA-processing protein 3
MAAYRRIVERARDPLFFTRWGVPDTFDGRFETLALHAFLALNRLKTDPAAKKFAQGLFDTMFADLDRTMREMGATDIGVGRYVKDMAQGFYGRIAAYERGLKDGDTMLKDALRRNLYGTAAPNEEQLDWAAAYLRRQEAMLHATPTARLLAGEMPFAPI